MENAGLVEMALVFGVALAIGGWELWTLRRDRRRAAARDADRLHADRPDADRLQADRPITRRPRADHGST